MLSFLLFSVFVFSIYIYDYVRFLFQEKTREENSNKDELSAAYYYG